MIEDRTPVDLEPYKTGKKKMMMKCRGFDNSGCGKEIDITQEYITCETQNNIRKLDPQYREGSDKLYIFPKKCENCTTKNDKSD